MAASPGTTIPIPSISRSMLTSIRQISPIADAFSEAVRIDQSLERLVMRWGSRRESGGLRPWRSRGR
jgi:hypothetical protein